MTTQEYFDKLSIAGLAVKSLRHDFAKYSSCQARVSEAHLEMDVAAKAKILEELDDISERLRMLHRAVERQACEVVVLR